MSKFQVQALERFLVVTTYTVEADTAEEARLRVRAGLEAYDAHEITEGDDEFVEFKDVEMLEDGSPSRPCARITSPEVCEVGERTVRDLLRASIQDGRVAPEFDPDRIPISQAITLLDDSHPVIYIEPLE